MERSKGLSRRATLGRLGSGVAAAIAAPALLAAQPAAAQQATPVATPVTGTADRPLPPEILAIIEAPEYAFARWGIHLQDRASGEVIYDLNGNQRFLAASTTKLFPTAAALHAYSPDYRFETPIYRQGDLADGMLTGNLILVASGDPTMGGRTTPEGGIAYTSIDHIYANQFPTLATLTPENPLAGIEDLAEQVKAAGIDRVNGNVVIDDRLFPSFPKDDYIITPIWINDNLIDLTIAPGAEGGPATIDWRPLTAAFKVRSTVITSAAAQPAAVTVSSDAPGVIDVAGSVPVTGGSVLRVFQVADPAAFARTVLIEALVQAGVEVTATPTGPNPAHLLLAPDSYAADDRVALLISPPFAENIKLINKVSMNQHADLLIMLLALNAGETTFAAGMAHIRAFLEEIALDPELVSLSDGRGNEYTDLFSPATASRLLRVMSTRSDFAPYYDSLPILGVDGSEAMTVPADSPVAGKARAKSGTTVAGDLVNSRPIIMTRALAGYLTAKSGRELIFATYVNDVPVPTLNDLFPILEQQGTIAEIMYDLN